MTIKFFLGILTTLTVFFFPIWTFALVLPLLIFYNLWPVALLLSLLIDILTIPHNTLPFYFEFQFLTLTIVLIGLYSIFYKIFFINNV